MIFYNAHINFISCKEFFKCLLEQLFIIIFFRLILFLVKRCKKCITLSNTVISFCLFCLRKFARSKA